jgi:hypothetical protein
MVERSILDEYVNRLNETYKQGDYTEMSYRTHLQNLIEKSFNNCRLTEEAKQAESSIGRPDFKARYGGADIGYIETKDLFTDLMPVLESEQIKKYTASIDNLILTNYSRFLLIRNQAIILDVELVPKYEADQKGWNVSDDKVGRLHKLFETFLEFDLPTIKSAENLATEMAKKCKLLKDLAKNQLNKDLHNVKFKETTSSILEFYKLIQTLLPDITEDDCADAYAQTIGYGMFLGRYYQLHSSRKLSPGNEGITRENVAQFIPESIGLIRKILHEAGFMLPENLRWIVDEICYIMNKSDIESTLKDVTERTGHKSEREKDAFLLFYEDFLGKYDPDKRKSRGVYYTPRQVVSFIVRSVEAVLKSKFGKDDGFADDSVTVLDPATGTGTFLNLVFIRSLLQLSYTGRGGLIRDKIDSHVLKDFYGFELLIPPYILAHLKLSRQLSNWGTNIEGESRVQVYLTNTLEKPFGNNPSTLDAFMQEITKEGKAASEIKKKPILVILGNPPYSGESSNKGDWMTRSLKEGYNRADGSLDEGYYKVEGQDINERNTKWLQDDYVKFIRFAQRKIDELDEGVLAFITNHAYLDNPTFRGMRYSLLGSFDEIYVLNLHGNSSKKERSPDGSKDENVFDIKQGVSISIFIKNKKRRNPSVIHYSDLWGLREEKYRLLDKGNLNSLDWNNLAPAPPYYLFTPTSITDPSNYRDAPSIVDIFLSNSVGIITARDDLTIKKNPEEVWRTINEFSELDPEAARVKYTLGKDAQDWQVKLAQEDIKSSGPVRQNIQPILYRPFDVRYTYYTGKSKGFICRPRKEIMTEMTSKNVGLVSVRQVAEGVFNHAFVTNSLIDARLTTSNKGVAYLFPLYSFKNGEQTDNINPKILERFRTNLETDVSPLEVFYYVYGVLNSKSYRTQFADWLKIDFPRIPIPKSLEIFQVVSNVGKRLTELHLMESKLSVQTHFEISGENEVKYVKFKDDKIYINDTQVFSGVSKEIFDFTICGYKVLDKWLKNRLKYKLNSKEIELFMQIVESIRLTIEISKSIDSIDFSNI